MDRIEALKESSPRNSRGWSLSWSEADEEDFTHDYERILHSCSFKLDDAVPEKTSRTVDNKVPPQKTADPDDLRALEEFCRRVSQRADRSDVITLDDAAQVSLEMERETGERLSVQQAPCTTTPS